MEVFEGEQAKLELSVISGLFHQRITHNLKLVALKALATADLTKTSRDLRHVVANEGLERIIDELRRSPDLAALEGGMIAVEVVPTANPTRTYVHWQQGMPAAFKERMYAVAATDPARFVEAVIPVGTTFDLRDAAHQQELAASPVYTSIYDTLDDSWVSVALERTPEATWFLTCWHQVYAFHHRLHLRTALSQLAPPLRTAFWNLGLFGPLPSSRPTLRKSFVQGADLEPSQNSYAPNELYGKIGLLYNHNSLIEKTAPPSLAELSIEELTAERDRLRALLGSVEAQLLERLGFARAVPVRTFSARASRIVDGFEQDPRPIVIHVSGTDRSCILKPADPDDLPEEAISISRLGQQASPLVKRISQSSGSGAIRVGIWRGGKRSGRIWAELCPPNDDSQVFLVVIESQRKEEI